MKFDVEMEMKVKKPSIASASANFSPGAGLGENIKSCLKHQKVTIFLLYWKSKKNMLFCRAKGVGPGVKSMAS